MLPSMYTLDHRLGELRPSERDLERARRLRDAEAPSRTVVRASDVAGRAHGTTPVAGRPSHLPAG